jgi:hypothetical protein
MKGTNAYTIFVGKPEGKRFLRRPVHRWEDTIIIDIKNSLGKCRLGSSDLGYRPVTVSCEHGNKPPVSKKGEEILD